MITPVLIFGYALVAEEKVALPPIRGEVVGDAKTWAGRGSAPRMLVRLSDGEVVKVTGGAEVGAIVCVERRRGAITRLRTNHLISRKLCGVAPPKADIRPLPLPGR